MNFSYFVMPVPDRVWDDREACPASWIGVQDRLTTLSKVEGEASLFLDSCWSLSRTGCGAGITRDAELLAVADPSFLVGALHQRWRG